MRQRLVSWISLFLVESPTEQSVGRTGRGWRAGRDGVPLSHSPFPHLYYAWLPTFSDHTIL